MKKNNKIIRILYENEQSDFRKIPKWIIILNSFLVILLIYLVFYYAFSRFLYNFNWDQIYHYRSKFIKGFGMTFLISFFSLILSMLIGIGFALGQISRIHFIRLFSKLYIQIIRGTPLLVQILIFFYVIADAFHLNNRYIVGVLIMSFFSGAYISEIVRGGIESIGKSQKEAIKACGFTSYQKYRYIIFPQMFKIILPALAGQFASLIKDSSLLSIISVSEFTLNAQEVNAFTYSTLESYIPLAIGYLLLTYPLALLSKHLERKYHYET